MLRILILASILIGINANHPHWNDFNHCGQRPLQPDRIVNGNIAAVGDWPWQVSLNNNGRHFCGGSLINDEWIISAAHCFSGSTAGYTILLALHDRLAQETWVVTRRFKSLINHPQWNPTQLRNDISLIKMDRSIKPYSNEIRPICMPTHAEELDAHANKTTHVTGWGAGRIGGPLYQYLMEGKHVVLPAARCQLKYGARFSPQTQVCGGEIGDQAGPCQGDSGGPFTRQHKDGYWYLIGVVSWGIGCGDGGVYTRVDSFLPWLESIIPQYPN